MRSHPGCSGEQPGGASLAPLQRREYIAFLDQVGNDLNGVSPQDTGPAIGGPSLHRKVVISDNDFISAISIHDIVNS